jgi:hypothetical protein
MRIVLAVAVAALIGAVVLGMGHSFLTVFVFAAGISAMGFGVLALPSLAWLRRKNYSLNVKAAFAVGAVIGCLSVLLFVLFFHWFFSSRGIIAGACGGGVGLAMYNRISNRPIEASGIDDRIGYVICLLCTTAIAILGFYYPEWFANKNAAEDDRFGFAMMISIPFLFGAIGGAVWNYYQLLRLQNRTGNIFLKIIGTGLFLISISPIMTLAFRLRN